jgi:hypothetical protein
MVVEEFFELGVEASCTWGCSNKNKSSVILRLTYDVNLKNLSVIHMVSKNSQTNCILFYLHFLITLSISKLHHPLN